MSFEQINSIKKVEPDLTQTGVVGAAQVQASMQQKPVEAAKATSGDSEAKSNKQNQAAVMSGNVRLKFIVDGQSNDVTVLVVNRDTQEVMRTIPPEELREYKDGDLLSLFA